MDIYVQQSTATAVATPGLAVAPTGAASFSTWKNIGAEGDWITVGAGTTVRYGANGKYVQIVIPVSQTSFIASNAFFGTDPVRGVHKDVDMLISSAVR